VFAPQTLTDRIDPSEALPTNRIEERRFDRAHAGVLEVDELSAGSKSFHQALHDGSHERWREVVEWQSADDVVELTAQRCIFYRRTMQLHSCASAIRAVRTKDLVLKLTTERLVDLDDVQFVAAPKRTKNVARKWPGSRAHFEQAFRPGGVAKRARHHLREG